jgi:IS5 family transposase
MPIWLPQGALSRPRKELTVRQRASNRQFGKVCAKVEHVFRVLKCQFGYHKVRYRGLAKNAAQLFSLLALANLHLAPRTLASATSLADTCVDHRRPATASFPNADKAQ